MKIKRISVSMLLVILAVPLFSCGKNEITEKKSVLDFEINGLYTGVMTPVQLSKYKGDVILIVNTASQCGFTPQYIKLNGLYIKYHDKGFDIFSFPSNSFNQEPLTNEEIFTLCKESLMVPFHVFTLLDVKGPNMHPIYKFLTSPETNPQFSGEITWNFEKFLIDRKGEIIGRFEPKMEPDDPVIIEAIEKVL